MKTELNKFYPINGYEGLYEINKQGDVRNAKRGVILKTTKGRYITLCLSKENKRMCKKIHRLLAETFIEKIESKNHVNHIDGNRFNNSLSNLEWCTHKENMQHSWANGLNRSTEKQRITARESQKKAAESRKKIILNVQTGVYYFGSKEAHEQTEFQLIQFRCMLNGISKNKTNFIYA